MSGDNWVKRRDNLEANIPDAWNLICISIEQAATAFAYTRYARERKSICVARRINDCVHMVIAPVSGGPSEETFDICLDRKKHRVFSRHETVEKASLKFVADSQDKAVLVGKDGSQLTEDQASEFFMKSFLFPEG